MKVEIWSDVVCPWCAIGKRRLEAALARFPHRDAVGAVWRSFELDPDVVPGAHATLPDRLAAKYGVSVAEAQAMNDRVTQVAAGEGLAFRLDRARPANTFDAHRLIHLARAERRAGEAVDRLFGAYFTDGRQLDDPEALAALGAEVGLDPDDVRAALAAGRHADDVRHEEAEALALGIRAVPCFIFDRRYGVSGAQPADVLLGALERAWAEAEAAATPSRAGA
jgi:predicted DsbA family dithiol-disulfide isomerase